MGRHHDGMHGAHACDTPAARNRAHACRYANGNIAELYTLSLRNVHFGFSRTAKPDILPVRPIPGRYIANQLESGAHDDFSQRINDLDYNAVTVTKVTHNAGASWVRYSPAGLFYLTSKKQS